MAFRDSTARIVSRHWLRMPAPDAGADFELFIFTGIAVLSRTKGAGTSWEKGTVLINANYSNVVSRDHAIQPRHWTVDVHLASIFNADVANNTGWAIDAFSLDRRTNNLGGRNVVVAHGMLQITTKVAVRDIDAYIHRLSYHVTILGKVADYATPAPTH